MNFIEELKNSAPEIRLNESSRPSVGNVHLMRSWDGNSCQSRILNSGAEPVIVEEVVLFRTRHPGGPDTEFYGEGWQMHGQIAGTLSNRVDLGEYPDRTYFYQPQTPGMWKVYNLAMFTPPNGESLLLAFTSCFRFSGEFRFNSDFMEIVMVTESLTLYPGQTWDLEKFHVATGERTDVLLEELTTQINHSHPPLKFPSIPNGWCSYYCFYEDVTQEQVLDNAKFVAQNLPQLKYLQIDSGYETFFGDWLDGSRFSLGMKEVCQRIRDCGLEPAVWVGPFMVHQDSQLFHTHPDWLLRDEKGLPFTSFRHINKEGNWVQDEGYGLDGTHPEAQKYLQKVFQTMRDEWGVTYFKLDGMVLGASHSVYHFDPNPTRVEAYRRGLQAIVEAVPDCFILGGNAPMWPSLGLVHGMRVTNDIDRRYKKFRELGHELFYRSWQHQRLWINDPDCLVLKNFANTNVSEDEFLLLAAILYASGGSMLVSENMVNLTPDQVDRVCKLAQPTGVAAQFQDNTYKIGWTNLPDRKIVFFFNWGEVPIDLEYPVAQSTRVEDFWGGDRIHIVHTKLRIKAMPGHSARIFTCFAA